MKKNNNLIAVVNNDLLMVSKNTPDCMVEDNTVDGLEIVSSAITNHVTKDKRFIDAVGKENAKKVQFFVSSACYETEDCSSRKYCIDIVMLVGEQETDFYYIYYLSEYPNVESIDYSPFVLYNNNGKSQLMQVFEAWGKGITSAKTFKNGHKQLQPNEKTLEEIFSEILSEGDLKIY